MCSSAGAARCRFGFRSTEPWGGRALIWETEGGVASSADIVETRHLCYFILTFHRTMSTEDGDAGPACGEASGGSAVTRRHTWEDHEPLASQGRPHPGEGDDARREDEGEEAEGCGDARGGNAEKFNVEDNGGDFSREEGAVGGRSCKTMHSNCSSETCIPTPSCRICFQGAEQVSCARRCLMFGQYFVILSVFSDGKLRVCECLKLTSAEAEGDALWTLIG